MSDVFFLVLRRLRAPLILLIVVYSVATLGMVLIPGQNDVGEPWQMSFFHAFYFVSFMGTTIGFGEVPYEFTDAQRAWVLVCIYTSVITWLYAIGNVLKLVQDQTFQQAIAERGFRRAIERIEQPFYIICGFGETGYLVNRSLSRLGIQTVIIDYKEEQTSLLELEDLRYQPITLTADGSDPKVLLKAGINRALCHGVIAVTEHDHTNLQVAVSSKLLNANVSVICRADDEDEAANMDSFGTDVIINPYTSFACQLNMLANKPELHQIQSWLRNQHNPQEITARSLPKGKWIICGYGRLGQAIAKHVRSEQIELIIVDPDPESHQAPKGTIIGRGTEAKTLQQAGINDANVIIASSDDDANNLSALITAKQLNPNVYTIGRVCDEVNHVLYRQLGCDFIMKRSQLMANEIVTSVSRPLVGKFIQYSDSLSENDTLKLVEEISNIIGRRGPVSWRLCLDPVNAPALYEHLQNNKPLLVGDVTRHPAVPHSQCIPLLLFRNGVSQLLPSLSTELQANDHLLVCGHIRDTFLAERLSHNSELIESIINNNPHHIPLLRWLSNRPAKTHL